MPLSFDSEVARRPIRLPTLLLHPLKSSQSEDTHFEPESEGYLDELIEEDKRRVRRRRVVWLSVIILAAIALITAATLAYQWTQSHYFVGEDDGVVVIFQGVQQNIGPISLSSVYQTTQIEVSDLPAFEQDKVEDTIPAESLRHAMEIVDRLAVAAEQ
jgi:protein phosphatase